MVNFRKNNNEVVLKVAPFISIIAAILFLAFISAALAPYMAGLGSDETVSMQNGIPVAINRFDRSKWHEITAQQFAAWNFWMRAFICLSVLAVLGFIPTGVAFYRTIRAKATQST